MRERGEESTRVDIADRFSAATPNCDPSHAFFAQPHAVLVNRQKWLGRNRQILQAELHCWMQFGSLGCLERLQKPVEFRRPFQRKTAMTRLHRGSRNLAALVREHCGKRERKRARVSLSCGLVFVCCGRVCEATGPTGNFCLSSFMVPYH